MNMPKPELYVIFTGERKEIPDVISLSEEFFGGEKTAIDAEVKVLYRENEGDIIGQYIIFCKVYNKQRMLYGNTRQAVTETIRICKDRNILREYLESREQEVIDMMMTLFDDDQIMKAYTKDIKDSTARETARETARTMLMNGRISVEEIPGFFPKLTLEDAKELEAEAMRPV